MQPSLFAETNRRDLHSLTLLAAFQNSAAEELLSLAKLFTAWFMTTSATMVATMICPISPLVLPIRLSN
jgi:hypothetical protein